MKDFAVRLLRAGVTEQRPIAAHLQLHFELTCEPDPAPESGYFKGLAKWAAGSKLADEERAIAQLAESIRRRREDRGL